MAKSRIIEISIPETISDSRAREVLMVVRELSNKHSLSLSTRTIVTAEKTAKKMVKKMDVKLLEKK